MCSAFLGWADVEESVPPVPREQVAAVGTQKYMKRG